MIPLNKVYFIMYDPGGCGSFVQNILNLSKKFSNGDFDLDFSDGTSHNQKALGDCFNRFHGISLLDDFTGHEECDIQQQEYRKMTSSRDVLISHLEKYWGIKPWLVEYNPELHSHRIHSLGLFKIIEFLPESKFIYCKLNPIKAANNIEAKILNNARKIGSLQKGYYIHDIGSPKYYWHTLQSCIMNYNAIEEFLEFKEYDNLLTLDIDSLVYDDNTQEIEKLLEFTTIGDVSRNTIEEIVLKYRTANMNLKRSPHWDKFLTAYKKLTIDSKYDTLQ